MRLADWPRAAVTFRDNEAVERRVVALETKRPLDLDKVDRAVRRLHQPELLADRLGDAVRYSQRVEADVAGLSIDVLLPHAESDQIGRFLTVWVPDELGHAHAQELLLDTLGLPVFAAQPSDAVPLHNRVAGMLGRFLPRAKEIVSMSYHTIGAINERLAMGAYGRMAEIAHSLGERELAEVLLEPMRRDESGHLGYYRTYARQLATRLAPWQRSLVRSLIVRTYAPVGAGRRPDRPLFGRALIALEDDPDNPDISHAVDGIARDLLAADGEPVPSFVLAAMRDCVAAARAV
jgi:hypothetical protein